MATVRHHLPRALQLFEPAGGGADRRSAGLALVDVGTLAPMGVAFGCGSRLREQAANQRPR